MALKLSLKPHERIIIGGAVITNGATKSEFLVENTVPILRHKHILSPQEADSPAKRIYMTIQLMYVDGEKVAQYHKIYWELVRDFLSAIPRAVGIIDCVSEHIAQNRYYDALKEARKLINFEEEVLERAKQCCESL
ncbi:MAG: flagellar biosynthesis repressor FlbT [Desulfobacteraceae bacterium]|nr:flagellar biosynthesis repressor FlbT [Desulfobacteraceae bacterium]